MPNFLRNQLKILRNCRNFSSEPRRTREVLGAAINWYPGHMEKGLKSINSHLSNVDVIIEMHDSRLPFTGRCNFVQEASQIRPRILVLNKCDLAEPIQNPSEFRQKLLSVDSFSNFQQPPVDLFFTNMKSPERQKRVLNDLLISLAKLAPNADNISMPENEFSFSELDDTDAHQTENPRAVVTAIVVGLPNCGKSSLINALRSFSMAGRRKAVSVGKSAGHTRTVSGVIVITPNFPITIDGGGGIRECSIKMLDTPGILEPKALTLCGQLSLDVCGAINWDSVDLELLADYLLFSLNRKKLFSYVKLFGMRGPTDNISVLLAWICARQKFFLRPTSNRILLESVENANLEDLPPPLPRPHFHLAAHYFLRLFCEGRFGRITFLPDDEEAASKFFVLHNSCKKKQ